jgi:L,D-transpeptidase ErfK/SrfK
MAKRWQMGGAVMAAFIMLLVGADGASAGRWTEEDFARRIPTNYPVTSRDAVVGVLTTHTVQEGDTMLDVGRHFDLGYNEMIAANPGVDPWLPPTGEVLLIPTEYVLPESSNQGIVVNIPEMRLYYFHGGTNQGPFVTTYPVGLGRDDWRTPQGSFRVRGKTENPTWVIPESIRAEHIRERGDDRSMIPGGADDNPLGLFRLELTLPLYALHGSNMPWGVGMQVSHGCIRLYNEDIAALFHEVRVGTPGEFVYQPLKVGMRNDVVYVEVHPDIYGLHVSPEDEAQALLTRHGWMERVDRARLHQALIDRSGIPVAIERDRRVVTAAAD